MSFTANEIETIVKELTELKEKCDIKEINELETFKDFRTKNRMLYEMILSPEGLNEGIFKEMMKMKRRLEKGEDQYSVDVRFGKFMAEKYLDPVTEKLKKS